MQVSEPSATRAGVEHADARARRWRCRRPSYGYPTDRSMLALRLIERKRDGGRIEPGEWRALAQRVRRRPRARLPDGRVPHGVLSSAASTAARRTRSPTRCCDSGETLDLARPRTAAHRQALHRRRGRQGLASCSRRSIASLGVAVPMMSGRGLGHTGGTLDKLESIPGFRTDLTLAEARAQLERIGCALIGQTDEIAPADRKMYALRDATCTVESIPLIAASIMSKKLAEGLTGLVLDVKRGSGAFLPELERGLELAHDDDRARRRSRLSGRRAAHRDGPSARPRVRQRARGGGVDRRAARRGAARPDGGDLRARRRDARARPASRRTSTRRAAHDGERDRHRARGGAVPGDHRGAGRQPGGRRRSGAAAAGGGGASCSPRRGAASSRASSRAPSAAASPRSAAAARRWRTRSISSVGFVITARPGDWVEQGEPLATIFARDRAGVEAGRAALRAAIIDRRRGRSAAAARLASRDERRASSCSSAT